MDELVQRLRKAFEPKTPELQAQAAAAGLYCGLETRTDPATYRWDGMKRSAWRRVPFALFQYSLAGRGAYKEGTAGAVQAVTPGRGILTMIPSEHVYYLPAGETWTFFWVIVAHPYAVSRLSAAVGGRGKVLTASAVSPVVMAAVELFEGTCRGGFEDQFDREGAIFRAMLEFERHLHERSISASERDVLLADVRRHVMEHLDRRMDVSELAKRQSMSRSHFSHYFRKMTGRAPADYVTEVRLAEAARRLTTSEVALKDLAEACGFADANHLCKAFRRRYHLSPGAYRKQG